MDVPTDYRKPRTPDGAASGREVKCAAGGEGDGGSVGGEWVSRHFDYVLRQGGKAENLVLEVKEEKARVARA